MADSSSKLKQFIGSLVFAVVVATIFLYKIQEKLTPAPPLKVDLPTAPKKEGDSTPKTTDTNTKKDEKAEPKETPQPSVSNLTWSHFSQKFQNLEDKRHKVLLEVKQKLPPETSLHSSKKILLEPYENKSKEEPVSWGTIIRGWQQLNEHQQRLKTTTNNSKTMPKEHDEEN